MKDIKEKRNQIKERIKAKGVLTGEDRATYYSHWYFAAIHVAIMIKELTNKDALSAKLNLAPQLVQEVLNFLERNKLIEYQNGSYKIGETRIHLEKKSPLISKHHTNWRIEAIKSLERKNDNDLHYSSVITLSKSDAEKIKETLLKSLENIEQILKPSPEEELYSLNIDLFSL
jgi:uncharacterized protein (TIGR02147 family)